MATLVLQSAGAALGGLFGPLGALVGRTAGALVGSAIDRTVIGASKTVRGRPLSGGRIPGADEGDGIARVHGTVRVAGTLIWATRFEETRSTSRTGGKASQPKVETLAYFGNFAIGLCEGEIAGLRRVWADGREIDLTEIEMRVYRGTRDQWPDPLIEAKQGAGNAPAYRGLAYVVFERLALDRFGNRIPVMTFEVIRPVGRLEPSVRAITMIPGSSEHGYDPVIVTEQPAEGAERRINRNILHNHSDWRGALDELQAICPNLQSVALVTAWFGDDLRAGACRIRPGVETLSRQAESKPWRVGGIARENAYLVSQIDGRPAYGGTPNDASVVAAINELKARGLKVFVYPFVLMDIIGGSGLADPYGRAEQPPYPWRGRITCDPAIGLPGSADRTAAARAQVQAFCGTARAADFSIDDGMPVYQGSDEGFRRLVLHYAHLAALAGGVDGFVIGSEMRGLTWLRDETGAFAFVDQLVDLAQEARSILGAATRITYGADWTEYFGYQPQDGTGDVFFHLDPLWASPAIDAVGIDNYMPLSDWRDTDRANGNPDGFRIASDPHGLRQMIASGERFDWYYASDADRAARVRTPITDGLAGKPWVFRVKDLEGWWSNLHYERVAGAETAMPTAWMPGLKPIWFTELGCPAVDKGANQPNVFPDPKSSENAFPYHSSGARDDVMQRRFLEAHLDYWTSSEPLAGMVDPSHIFLWTWDARPYPAFPYQRDLWSDGPNWSKGHWLNGRLGTTAMPDLIRSILSDWGIDAGEIDCAMVAGDVTGFLQSDPSSARALIEPMLNALQIDAVATSQGLRFKSRALAEARPVVLDVLADSDDGPLVEENRLHDSEVASETVIDHFDPGRDYEAAAARSRRLAFGNRRQRRISLPAVIEPAAAQAYSEAWLKAMSAGLRTVRFALPPSSAALEPGDVVQLAEIGNTVFVVTGIEDGERRRVNAEGIASSGMSGGQDLLVSRLPGGLAAASGFNPLVVFLDLPVLSGSDPLAHARVAVHSVPFRPVSLSLSAASESYQRRVIADGPVTVGRLADALAPGRHAGLFDRHQHIDIDLVGGAFESRAQTAVLAGANVLAIESLTGEFEIVQFRDAEETAPGRWRVSMLLRGQAGSEAGMAAGAAQGARVVLVDAGVPALALMADEVGVSRNWIVEPVSGPSGRAGPYAFTGGLAAATPLAPVHLKARRGDDGDLVLSWIRRGRFDADSWLASDIPLDEEKESYRLDILDGLSVRRSVELDAPRFVYGQALEIADFGAPLSVISIRVRQIGRTVPQGRPAEALLRI